jgi:hypothetical protein
MGEPGVTLRLEKAGRQEEEEKLFFKRWNIMDTTLSAGQDLTIEERKHEKLPCRRRQRPSNNGRYPRETAKRWTAHKAGLVGSPPPELQRCSAKLGRTQDAVVLFQPRTENHVGENPIGESKCRLIGYLGCVMLSGRAAEPASGGPGESCNWVV